MSSPFADPAFRRLVPTTYLPWVAMALGLGVLSVALPLYLLDGGASFTATSVVLAAAGFGAFVAGLPSGSLIASRGALPVYAAGLVLLAICVALTALSQSPAVLTALQFAVGAGATAMRLAAQSHITAEIEPMLRGRAMSGMGGMRRLGAFVGPLLGGALVDAVGFGATFLLSGVITAAGLLPLVGALTRRSAAKIDTVGTARLSLLAALRRHGRLLVRTGSGPFLIMAARRGRSILLPLVAAAFDVNATTVGVIVAIGTGADLLLFPVAGWLMDRYGRLLAIGPAFSIMAIGLFLLAGVDTAAGVVAAGALIGVGNGLSAGTMMTIASDLAPDDAPSQFMAGFGTVQDAGQLVGPLAVGIVADATSLGAASVVLGVALLVGLALILVTIGESSSQASTPMPAG